MCAGPTLVHEEGGEAQAVEKLDELEMPDADTRTDESHERLRHPGSAEMRHVTAGDVAHDTHDGSDERDDDADESNDRDEESDESESGDEKGSGDED